MEIKEARKQHLADMLSATSGSLEMKPHAFQQAIANLGRLLELREQIAEAEKEEQRATQRWGEVRVLA